MTQPPGTLAFAAYTAYLGIVSDTLPTLGFDVYDGPQQSYPGARSFIAVGVDDLSGLRDDVVAIDSGSQAWEALGAGVRMETFLINAVLVAWDGSGAGITACRSAAYDAVQALNGALRPAPYGTGDAMLNDTLNSGGTGWCGLSVTRVSQRRNSAGCAVLTYLALACTARV